jgi:hypothetical protein
LAGIVGSVCCRIFAIISDTPPQDRAAVSKTNLEPQLFCTMLRQKLGGKIRKLILSVKMKNFQHAFFEPYHGQNAGQFEGVSCENVALD